MQLFTVNSNCGQCHPFNCSCYRKCSRHFGLHFWTLALFLRSILNEIQNNMSRWEHRTTKTKGLRSLIKDGCWNAELKSPFELCRFRKLLISNNGVSNGSLLRKLSFWQQRCHLQTAVYSKPSSRLTSQWTFFQQWAHEHFWRSPMNNVLEVIQDV